jgi:hypothetical protein
MIIFRATNEVDEFIYATVQKTATNSLEVHGAPWDLASGDLARRLASVVVSHLRGLLSVLSGGMHTFSPAGAQGVLAAASC